MDYIIGGVIFSAVVLGLGLWIGVSASYSQRIDRRRRGGERFAKSWWRDAWGTPRKQP